MLPCQIRRHLLVALLLAATGSSHAEETINVNLLVFAQPEHGVSFELWRPAAELRLTYPANLIDLQGQLAPRDERYAENPASTSPRIDRSAQRLQAADYRVLLQKSWSQPIPAAENAQSVLIRGGQEMGDHRELEGYLTIYHHENRIRLGTHLWLSSMAQGSNAQTSTAVLPDITSADASIKSDVPGIPVANVIPLNDTRILNEGELHYIDHPKFGFLIEIGNGETSAGASDTEQAAEGEPSDGMENADTNPTGNSE